MFGRHFFDGCLDFRIPGPGVPGFSLIVGLFFVLFCCFECSSFWIIVFLFVSGFRFIFCVATFG